MVIIVLFTYNYLSSLNEIFEFQYFYLFTQSDFFNISYIGNATNDTR